MAIHNDLVEAYVGTYEDSKKKFTHNGVFHEGLFNEWIELKIKSDSPKDRLKVYLEWNGILGWHGRIWSIASGEFQS